MTATATKYVTPDELRKLIENNPRTAEKPVEVRFAGHRHGIFETFTHDNGLVLEIEPLENV